ncbi:serpentine type 7TM GPCR chemoreceptor sra domain-containing protein [Ditylenchus destructor]|nr:serpentine type 7TM GPCR chemoreceptor sra domain-containing protein [Ditylenchus destructor]
MNISLCLLAKEISHNVVIRISHLQQFIGCLLGIGSLSYFVFKRHKMPQLLDGSTKVLIWWMIGFVITHNTFLCLVNVWHEVHYFTYSNACDLLTRTWICLLFRATTCASAIGMSAVYIILLIDRLCSIFIHRYYPRDKAPLIISLVLISFVSAVVILVFRNEDFSAYVPYCVSTSRQNTILLTIIYASLLCSHILCTFGFFLMLKHFFCLLKGNKHNFIVDEKLKIRMDIASVRFMMAATVNSFVFIGSYLSANFIIRRVLDYDNMIGRYSLINAFYVIQWYGVMLSLLLYNWKSFSIGHRRIVEPDGAEQLSL